MKEKTWRADISNNHKKREINNTIPERILTKGLVLAKPKHKNLKKISEISAVFTDDKEIKWFNKTYRGKNKATDVLSFSQLEGELDKATLSDSLGDIMISLDTAIKQAKENDLTTEQEVLRLLIHGMLHLLGYEHVNVDENTVKEMQQWEDFLFSKLKNSWRKNWITIKRIRKNS